MDLFISVVTLPYVIFKINTIIKVSHRWKSRQQHNIEIARIATVLRHAVQQNPQVQIALSRKLGDGHSMRSPAYKNGKYQIDLSALTSILEINEKNKYADVEALVTFQELCKATLKHGLLPLVVPGLKLITIGGAIQGLGADSTSWMYGTFDKTVIDATLITGDGKIISSSEAPDLWKALPGSNGTLALVVAARIQLIEATEWIRLRYVYYPDSSLFVKAVQERTATKTNLGWIGGNQIMNALQFCEGDGCLSETVGMYGGCIVKPESDIPVHKETPFSPFFYQHVKTILTEKKIHDCHDVHTLHEEYMPTLDYLFRHDKGAYWAIEMMRFLLPPAQFIIQMPVCRGLLHHFLSACTLKKLVTFISTEDMCKLSMIQDVVVPLERAQELMHWTAEKELQRLWLCPMLCGNDDGLFSIIQSKSGMAIDVGICEVAKNLPESNLDLQRFTAKLNGKTALYSYIYANREEFWTWYNHEEYIQLRKKWSGNVFMDLWDKVACQTFS